jgi:lipoprotein LprG
MRLTGTRLDTRWAAALLAPALLLATAACSGDDGGSGGGDSTEEVLASAKKSLDDTSGVNIALTTDKLPPGVDGVVEATGTGTHAPAFDGSIKVVVNNLNVDVPVVAVQGAVYAKLPFTTTFAEIDPSDYGAPDPADLMDPENGISGWLTAAEDVEKGEQTRDGDQVLTSYTGTLPGSAVAGVIPSADKKADFDATFEIDDEGRLVTADVKGPFYGSKGDVDYEITLSSYGTDKDIKAP